jgi:hypothetical protein
MERRQSRQEVNERRRDVMARENEAKIVEILMVAPVRSSTENMMMQGVNGRLRWVDYVGRFGNKKLYQADHEWVFGKKQKKRIRGKQ